MCPTLFYNYEIVLKNDSMQVIDMMNIQCYASNNSRHCSLDISLNGPVYYYYIVEITQVNVDQGDIRGPTYFSPRISKTL